MDPPNTSTLTDAFEHALLRVVFHESPVGLAVLGRDMRHLRVNAAVAEMMRLPAESIIGCTPAELHGRLGEESEALYREVMESGVPRTGIEVSGAADTEPQVEWHWCLHSFPIRIDGAIVGIGVVIEDVSERRLLREQLAHLAYHDSLTGLPNRAMLSEHLGRLLARRPPAPQVGVMFVDVDMFKAINDVHGHAAGDAALQSVAACLPQLIRPTDLAGRWGGDEFVIVADDITGVQLDELARRLQREAEVSVTFGHATIRPSLSIGTTIAQAGECLDLVLERADIAMYARKRAAS
jgi:diguanylate cyclase (GGDEF)-like protein